MQSNFLLLILLFLTIISCKQEVQQSNTVIESSTAGILQDTLSSQAIDESISTNEITTQVEPFDEFFEKFVKDLKFRVSRLESPLYMYKSDEPTKDHPDGFFPVEVDGESIFLTDNEWEDKVSYKHTKTDQKVLTLVEGTTMYIKMEYTFIMRDGQWILKSFKDLAV